MPKDGWDKLSVIGTFLQIVVLGAFTLLLSFYSSRMNNKLDAYKAGMDENNMIKTLVTDLTKDDAVSKVRTDFALLSLERYLRNAHEGVLTEYDKNMLVGFSQIIWDRLERDHDTLNVNEILIPKQFLKKNDSASYVEILDVVTSSQKQRFDPGVVNKDSITATPPVNQVLGTNVQALSALFSKTCYIQFANAGQKELVEKMRAQLNENGWYAPGVDLVAGNYPNSIKYFHKEDLETVNRLQEMLGVHYPAYYNGKYQNKVPKGQIELWLVNAAAR